jgi:hypothetical protein
VAFLVRFLGIPAQGVKQGQHVVIGEAAFPADLDPDRVALQQFVGLCLADLEVGAKALEVDEVR